MVQMSYGPLPEDIPDTKENSPDLTWWRKLDYWQCTIMWNFLTLLLKSYSRLNVGTCWSTHETFKYNSAIEISNESSEVVLDPVLFKWWGATNHISFILNSLSPQSFSLSPISGPWTSIQPLSCLSENFLELSKARRKSAPMKDANLSGWKSSHTSFFSGSMNRSLQWKKNKKPLPQF